MTRCRLYDNLTKVIPLFTLSHRGSHNSPLLIVFSANYIDQSNWNFMCLKVFWCMKYEVLTFWPFRSEKNTCPKWHENVNFIIFKNTAMRLNYAFWFKIMTQNPNYKVYTMFTWTRSVIWSYQILYAIV